MATAVGFVSGGAYGFSWIRSKNKAVRVSDMVCRVSCVSSSTTTRDPYKTLMLKPGASKSEVKKAFRRLALRGVDYGDQQSCSSFAFTGESSTVIEVLSWKCIPKSDIVRLLSISVPAKPPD
ncbi:hypothetical protein RHSIM_Rhsim04G0048800 [Rhododendron simsii]|uniref:Uncharacterized protein n=1 Tax=Rhododendron simsii TaxID=118357 RepID=A0A834LMI7_RHOSS|nr:hypothetical protein RHSIM_Rhsim04G0048800 [Rhododendron simsii]